jgi:hypothetical protein
MKVFFSWSGDYSLAVAKALNDLIAQGLKAVRPFFSPNITRGVPWGPRLMAALQTTRYGIVCLTPDNLDSLWMNFEVGALFRAKGSLVWTFLHNVEPENVPGPLKQFQSTISTENDVLELLKTMNNRIGKTSRMPLNQLEQNFKRAWPIMEKKLKAAEKKFGKPLLSRASFGKGADVEEVRTFVGDWRSIRMEGVRALTNREPIRSLDLLAVYNADSMGDIADDLIDRRGVKIRICLANTFDAPLNDVYRRLYQGKKRKQLCDATRESIQKLLGPCTLKVNSSGDITVSGIRKPPRAQFEIRLTDQRITFGYFRLNGVATIMPLDMKTKQKPAPVAWLLDKNTSPMTFKHYLMQYEKMFEEALCIYPPKRRR